MLVKIIILLCLLFHKQAQSYNDTNNSTNSTNFINQTNSFINQTNINISSTSEEPINENNITSNRTITQSKLPGNKAARFNPSKSIPSAKLYDTEIEDFLENPKHYNYQELTDTLKQLEEDYPDIVKLSSIGQSRWFRDLWVLHINRNTDNRTLLTPMFKFIANIHGDETVGRMLLIYLAQYLTKNYGTNKRVTWLVDNTDIHILPSMNPDGYSKSDEGRCFTKKDDIGRVNALNKDLNANFPDQFNPNEGLGKSMMFKRPPEVLGMMAWILTNPFVLSASLHGGSIVASYPFDGSDSDNESGEESKTPDDELFKQLALLYAERHPLMKTGNACKDDDFPLGIINGADWLALAGTMSDFNYVYSNCFEVGFEISCCKFPKADKLPNEWRNNKESMLSFIEASHWGVKGRVTNDRGESVDDADVIVEGIDKNVTTSPRGEYWRLLMPGKYEIYVVAEGYLTSPPVTVMVEKGKPTIRHFKLKYAQQGNFLRAQFLLIVCLLITLRFIIG